MRKILAGVLVLAAIALIAWYVSRPEPLAVALETVQRGTVESTVANTRAGTVMACRRARLAPAIGGQIAHLPVTEGDAVEAGQVLIELWNVDLAAEVTLAERDAGAAGARADESCTTADVARREAERIERLRARGLSSEEDADRTAGNATATAAACRAVRAAVSVAEARLDVARAALERTRLRAPFDGVIAEVNGEVGEFVTPSPVGIPTPPAVDLIDDSCLYVSAPIDEVDATAISRGLPVRITLDAFAERSFPGHVRRVAPYVLDIEKQARTVGIEVEFEALAENLLPGYSADVEVILGSHVDVLRVPTQAVLRGDHVLVYDAETRRLERREVQTGLSNWEYTEIVSGLSEGERIAVSVDRAGVEEGALVTPE